MVIKRDSIHNIDCVRGMRMMRPNSVDCVITDPPFAIGFGHKKANYNRVQSRVMPGYGEIDAGDYYGFSKKWMEGAYRVLKKSGSMYVFSGWNNLKDVLTALDDVKFRTINHIIWKYQFGVVTKNRYVTSHYHILYVCKDEKRRKFDGFARYTRIQKTPDGRSRHYMDKEDVWEIKREYWRGRQKTPTKLPAEIIRKILAYSSKKGDLILDPFLGSGQVAVEGKKMGRRYVGFEIVKKYHAFASKRLAAV